MNKNQHTFEAKNIVTGYDKKIIIDGIDLSVPSNKVSVIIGSNGCGKSTLIRRFYSELPKEDYIVLYLSDSKLTPRWFYKGLLDQLGLESRFYRGDSKRQLQQEIEIIRGVQHRKVVCILMKHI